MAKKNGSRKLLSDTPWTQYSHVRRFSRDRAQGTESEWPQTQPQRRMQKPMGRHFQSLKKSPSELAHLPLTCEEHNRYRYIPPQAPKAPTGPTAAALERWWVNDRQNQTVLQGSCDVKTGKHVGTADVGF